MKLRVLKTSLDSIFFLTLIIAVVALINPVYTRLNSFLRSETHKIAEKLNEKTGLLISYESLSPSVLSGINIRNITISDSHSKKQLIQVNKATITYRLRDFFSGTPVKGIKLLLLDGVVVEYDAVKDNEIVENLRQFFVDEDKKSRNELEPKVRKNITLNGRQVNISFDIQFKNLSLHYNDSHNDFLASIKNVLLERSPGIENGVLIKTSGRFDFRTDYVKTGNYRRIFACGFDISGTLFRNFEGSSFMLRLSEINRADYTLSKMDLLLNMADSKISFRTMKNSLPYSLLAEADFNRQLFSLELNALKFELLKLVKIRNNSELFNKFSGMTITGSLTASSSFAPEDSLVNSLILTTAGECHLGKRTLGSPVTFNYDISCRNQIVNVNSFKGSGEKLGVELNGSYNVRTGQPSGIFALDHFILGNGGVIQTEMYIEPYKNGFMCFAPQFFMNDRSLTAIQLTVLPSTKSVDFEIEFDDYSHAEYDRPGKVQVTGSFLNEKNRLIQASVSVSDMFVESLLQNASFFAGEESADMLKKTGQSLSGYIFSDEVYFSTDFKSFSFNSPFLILANTKKEREVVTCSAVGSNQTISLNNLDLQFGSQSAHASAGIDFVKGFKDFNFYSDFVINSIPYSFNGSYSSNFVNVSGDYNFSTAVTFGKTVSGTVDFAALPFAAGDKVFAVDANAGFEWSKQSGFQLEISRFDLEEPTGKIQIKPHLALSGSANRYGFVMEKVVYSDTVSALDGKLNVIWNLNDGIFDSILVDFNAKSIIGSEKIDLNAEFKNPLKKLFDIDSLKNDFYLSAQGKLSSFPSARFMTDQNSDNTINTEFSVTGTLTNPFFTLNLQKSSVNFAGYPAVVSAVAIFDDTGLTVSDVELNWGNLNVKDVFAQFNPKNYSGELMAAVSGNFVNYTFDIPLRAQVYSLSPEKKPAQNFVIALNSDKMTGTLFPSSAKLDMVVTKSPGRFDLVSAQGRGITGSIINGQVIAAKSGPDSPLSFNMEGTIIHNELDISIREIYADLKTFCQQISIPYVNFTAGTLTGAVKLTGITTDPEYTGAVSITKPEFYVPFVSKKLFKTDRLFATAGQNHFVVKQSPFTLDKNPVKVGLDIEFDRWGISYLDCLIDTDEGQFIPVDMGFPFIHYKGYAGFEKFLIRVNPGACSFTGKIFGERADIEVITKTAESKSENSIDFFVKLDLQVRNRVQILINPLMRGVIVPGNSLELMLDTRTNDFAARGEVNLRGGEIVWLNRNFYMKEGKVLFNESKGLFDPRVTVRAETRERDQDNNQVTIILSANGQRLSEFNPRFTSSPARSENEIMELLGQVISADSENVASLAVAGGDYLVQATVMRGVENALRELCNFDIFSIRTNVLQNAVKQSLERNSANKQITFGNFFDNSAVYVGKYFGSAMYVDALMHWSYDETKVGEEDSVNGLVLQPEFGLEMTSPFVNIRLGVAPDLEAIKKSLWMPSTSITLSWKHSF